MLDEVLDVQGGILSLVIGAIAQVAEDRLLQLQKVEKYWMEQFGFFLTRLKETKVFDEKTHRDFTNIHKVVKRNPCCGPCYAEQTKTIVANFILQRP